MNTVNLLSKELQYLALFNNFVTHYKVYKMEFKAT
jgi:hypothetical protein